MIKTSLAIICFFTLALSLSAQNYPSISIQELKKIMAGGTVVIIDVNGPKSYALGHIPTAIDFSSAKNNLTKFLPKDKNTLIVSYCGGPGCRAFKRGADAAAELGFTNIKYLPGGISGWKRSGAAISKD